MRNVKLMEFLRTRNSISFTYRYNMKVNVRVVPNAKRCEVVNENGNFKVYLNAPAVEGKANKVLAEILADYFGVRKSRVSIIKGIKARQKVVEVLC